MIRRAPRRTGGAPRCVAALLVLVLLVDVFVCRGLALAGTLLGQVHFLGGLAAELGYNPDLISHRQALVPDPVSADRAGRIKVPGVARYRESLPAAVGL